MCSQEVRPETVFKLKKKKKKKKTELCQFVFVVVQTEFDRSNTNLKSFIFCVQSGGSAGDCILFKFIKRTLSVCVRCG